MTVHITSGKSGWGNYVLYGTKEKPRDSDLVELIEGDIELGDRLSESNNYEEGYYKIVLSFEKKLTKEEALEVYEDFKKEFFVGFKKDEYHIDTVLHQDTERTHFHCRVPKQNLLTDTHLQLYMDKIDRPRKQLIQDHLSLKYGFAIAREQNREIFKEESHEYINKWREEQKQKPFDFSNKKAQAEAEAQINGYLSELVKTGLIEKREDITATLQELGLKIEKENGLDIKKDFCYTTVSNETGKMRIKGEIHHDRFYEHNQKDRTAQIDNNQRIIAEREPNQERIKTVRRELNKANERRFNKVQKLFKPARERAEREHKQTLENGRLESLNTNKSFKSSNRIIDSNTNTKDTNEVGTVHPREKLYSHRRSELSTIQPKRAVIRPTKTNLLLQNKIKDNRNERLIEQTITRIRTEREASESALQRARNSRELVQERITNNHEELQNRTNKIANYYGKIRTKVVNSFNEMKESFAKRLDDIQNKFTPKKDDIVIFKSEKDERLEKFIEQMESGTGNQEAKASTLNNKKDTQTELKSINEKKNDFSKIKTEVPEVTKETESTKKRSYQRQR